MVLISDGHSESGAHMRCEIGSLMCAGCLFQERAIANLKCIIKKNFFSSQVRNTYLATIKYKNLDSFQMQFYVRVLGKIKIVLFQK